MKDDPAAAATEGAMGREDPPTVSPPKEKSNLTSGKKNADRGLQKEILQI
jgi:hypothetical protein